MDRLERALDDRRRDRLQPEVRKGDGRPKGDDETTGWAPGVIPRS